MDSPNTHEKSEAVLEALFQGAPELPLEGHSKVVILSDLHIGDGGVNDDFKKNSSLYLEALESYYLPKGYTLVLNGDIEEYLRCTPSAIRKAWPRVFELFEAFRRDNRLFRIRGNHEMRSDLARLLDGYNPFDADALRMDWKGQSLFFFHGHQAGILNSGKYNSFIGLFLRIFANSLRIGNYSVAQDSSKKIKIEKAVYEFSRKKGILSVIGHTHRPLFESLSKQESYNFHIENLCRKYAKSDEERRERIRLAIDKYRQDFFVQKHESHLADTVYGDILIPCLFNSGCGVGKRGFTGLEIRRGRMLLVFWSDGKRAEKYRTLSGNRKGLRVGRSSFRFVLRKEKLDYIFSRISLLR